MGWVTKRAYENGASAFGWPMIGAGSFCCTSLTLQTSSGWAIACCSWVSVSPMLAMKYDRRPEPACGIRASMWPAGLPKSDQSVLAQV